MNEQAEKQAAAQFGEPWDQRHGTHTVNSEGAPVGQFVNPKYRCRAEVCVNACAGIEDPAAHIKSLREACESAANRLRNQGDVPDFTYQANIQVAIACELAARNS